MGRLAQPGAGGCSRAFASGGARLCLFLAFTPIVAMGLFALFTRRPENFIMEPLVVMSGLAAIVAAVTGSGSGTST